MEPMTRSEIFMASAAGEYDGELPTPITRQEQYLKKIIDQIDGGGSVSPEQIDAAIEAYLNSHDADIVTEAELTQALAGYYNKTDIDTALAGKAAASHSHDDRYYTESEIDTALSGKAAASHVHAQSDVTGLDSALAGKAAVSHAHDDRYYTETEIDNKLGEKSNTGHTHDDRYYTEDEIDTLLSGKADSSDIPDVSSFITKAVNDLTNYYTKSETYTQTEIDNMVSAIPKFAIEVVQALPSQNISPTTVYLLTVQNGEQGNMYDEYIYVGNSWEKLGTQTVDLSGYYTAAEVDALLSGLPVAGHTHDDRYYTETEIDGKIQTINTAISGKAASNHTHDDRYYTETEIDNKLSEKSNTGHSHVQSDITGLDSALAGKAAASHSHAQSDITGLSDALSGKADAAATQTALNAKQDALTAGDNVSIATVNGVLTISATDTDTTYSAGTGLSLSGTTFSNAAPNVQADWNAESGDAQILNHPSVDTAPTQNSTALVTSGGVYAAIQNANSNAPVVLYDSRNKDGNTSYADITLSDSLSNYSYVEIVTVNAGCFKVPVFTNPYLGIQTINNVDYPIAATVQMHRIIKHRPGGVESLGVFTELDIFYIDLVNGLSKMSRSKYESNEWNNNRYTGYFYIKEVSTVADTVVVVTDNRDSTAAISIYKILGYR